MTNSNRLPARFGKLALLGAALIGLLNPLLWWGLFSGDAEIHLVYARNLLRGYPWQFNLHMPNSGDTSMGFTLIAALIMRIFGAVLAPAIIELLCLLSLYLTAYVTLLIGRQLGVRRPWSEISAIIVLWLPGNAYTALYGTENVLFAALGCLFVYGLIRANWYDQPGSASVLQDAFLGIAAGVLFWIRPEAIPLICILLFVRAIAAIGFKRSWSRETFRVGAFVLTFAIAILAYIAIFRHYAGEMPYGAGKARRLFSMYNESVWFHGVPVNVKVLTRIASYFTVTLPALAIGIVALTRKNLNVAIRLRVLAFAGIFFSFLAAYVFNLLPAVHFARYSVFIWPYGLILAVLCLQSILDAQWCRPSFCAVGLIAWLLCFVGTAAYETRLRIKQIGEYPCHSLERVERVPQQRDQASAAMATRLGLPVGAPATLAFSEVETRYELNDNFTIISLDGITDARLLPYYCDKWVDHDGYLIDTKVDYVMEFPNYNADTSKWALADLLTLKVGQSLIRPGIIYRRIQPNIVQVQRTVNAGADRPGGNCPKGN